jgi:hypothetical protein
LIEIKKINNKKLYKKIEILIEEIKIKIKLEIF